MTTLESLTSGQVVADIQAQSCLFQLPLEVRRQIYEHVYPEHLLHMYWPTCEARWCIETDKQLHEDLHEVCDWVRVPEDTCLACRLPADDWHTFRFRHVQLFGDWTKILPAVHLEAVESLRVRVYWDPRGQEWQHVWDAIASLPRLKAICASIINCELPARWEADTLAAVVAPIKKVQQASIAKFDLLFGINRAWFEERYADHIEWSALSWHAFLVDFDRYGEFAGVHPKARVVCVDGFDTRHVVRDELPTMMDMIEWIEGFTNNPDYELENEEDYELGPRAKAFKAVQDKTTTEGRERKSQEVQKLAKELQDKYAGDKSFADGPDGWDWDAFKHLSELLDQTVLSELGRWTYPEKPEWWAV